MVLSPNANGGFLKSESESVLVRRLERRINAVFIAGATHHRHK